MKSHNQKPATHLRHLDYCLFQHYFDSFIFLKLLKIKWNKRYLHCAEYLLLQLWKALTTC